MTGENTIPLFPLGIVALPGAPVPLHIFEERYKEMIARCIEEGIEFGIVWFSGEQIRQTGCTVRILEVLKRYDDGRMDILTRGERRFRLFELLDRAPYLEGRVDFFEDESEPFPERLTPLAEKGRAVFEKLVSMLSADAAAPIDLSDPTFLSFVIAGFEGFGASEKQAFLEMTSTRDRLEKGIEAMERVLERLALTHRIERIIGGNGRPPESLRQHMGRNRPREDL